MMYIVCSFRNCLKSGSKLNNLAISNRCCISHILPKEQLRDIRTSSFNCSSNILIRDAPYENQRTVQEQFPHLDTVRMRHLSVFSALNYANVDQQQRWQTASEEKPTSIPTNGSGGGGGDEAPKKLSLWQRFKKMLKDYWYVVIPVHAGTSVLWFGSFYYLAKSGIDIMPLLNFLEYLGTSEIILRPLKSTGAGYLAVAYALFKIATPARYTVTLGGTTLAVTYLTRWGIIKPMMSGVQMRAMFQEGQRQLRSRRAQTLAKMNIRRKGSLPKNGSAKQNDP